MTTAPGGARDSFLLVTLDGFSLRRRLAGATEWVDVRLSEKCCVLIALLATVPSAVPRRLLCDLLWHGADTERARNSLRQALFRIRRVLGERSILETSHGMILARGVVEIDLLRAFAEVTDHAVSGRVGLRLAERFGRTTRPIGSAFEDWRSRVRGQLVRGEFTVESPVVGANGDGGFAGAREELQGDASAHQRLAQLFRLSSHGMPVTAWVTGGAEPDLRRVVDGFAADCRTEGATVATVSRWLGAGYARYALEREIAEVVWPLPGAVGVKPEHHLVLDRVAKGRPVENEDLRVATMDLIAAVAENAPLVIVLLNPSRYSVGALSSLVGNLAALHNRSAMLVIGDDTGTRPVHSLCIEVALPGGSAGGGPPSRDSNLHSMGTRSPS